MTDRELLERAAKAAGLRVVVRDVDPWPTGGVFWFYCEHGREGEGMYRSGPGQGFWNSLTQGQDSLRLAADRNMDVEVSREVGSVWAGNSDGQALVEVLPDGDWYAATMRAITRAAAEMAP